MATVVFAIKQHDTLPALTAQFFAADGTTPLDISSATSVFLVMKSTSAAPGDTPFLRKQITIVDGPTGKVKYQFLATETATAGSYNAEFELNFPTGIQTLPATDYFGITINPDLG